MIGKTLRLFSACGPCLTHADGAGLIIGETAKFWITHDRDEAPRRVSKTKGHVDPCPSCRDHERSQYPHGYMD